MHHPFDGVIVPDLAGGAAPAANHAEVSSATASRRSFIGKAFVLAAGAFAVLSGSRAKAQSQFSLGGPTQGSQTVRPEGGWHRPDQGQVTTYAIGEEGSGYPGGWRPSPYPPPQRYTTWALYEEGGYGSYRPPHYPRPPYGGGQYTTMALGEEGGTYTTMALGEEGGRGW
jgi:hypothetical protein